MEWAAFSSFGFSKGPAGLPGCGQRFLVGAVHASFPDGRLQEDRQGPRVLGYRGGGRTVSLGRLHSRSGDQECSQEADDPDAGRPHS